MGRRALRAVLACVDPWTLDQCEMRPFSYAIRKVQAAAVADPLLAHWDLHVLDLQATDVEEFVARIEEIDPDLLGVSAYCWSFPIFVEVSRRLKVSRPNLTIIFGGPSAREEMFKLEPFRNGPESIDALVLGEGEDIFRDVLALPDRSRASLGEVAGLAVSTGSQWRPTPPRTLPVLDSLASPYVLKLLGAGGGQDRATGHLETFRGCPFSCSFCQWGDLSGKANRAFSTEYLIRELTAFKDLNFHHALMMDAALNLNHRAFRNLVAAEREVGFFRDSHIITEVYPAHITDEHLMFLESTRYVTLSVGLQSLTKEVLDGVERPFNEARFHQVIKDLISVAPHTTIELILGLPGDTPASFRETLDRVFDLGCGVRVYRCLVLPSALMSRAPASFQLEYDPYTLRMRSCLGWSREELDGMLSELDDRVAAMDPDRAAVVLDDGNTFAFRPPGIVEHTEWDRKQSPAPELIVVNPSPPVEPMNTLDESESLPPPADVSEASAADFMETEAATSENATPPDDNVPREMPLSPVIQKLMAAAVHQATAGGWTLVSATSLADRMLLRVKLRNHEEQDIEVCPARPDARAYRVIGGMAFSYRDHGTPLSAADQRHMDAAVQGLRRAMAAAAKVASARRSSQSTTSAA